MSAVAYLHPLSVLQCAMFLGWITGMHPPGKTLAVFTAGKVVMHKLQVRLDPPGSHSKLQAHIADQRACRARV